MVVLDSFLKIIQSTWQTHSVSLSRDAAIVGIGSGIALTLSSGIFKENRAFEIFSILVTSVGVIGGIAFLGLLIFGIVISAIKHLASLGNKTESEQHAPNSSLSNELFLNISHYWWLYCLLGVTAYFGLALPFSITTLPTAITMQMGVLYGSSIALLTLYFLFGFNKPENHEKGFDYRDQNFYSEAYKKLCAAMIVFLVSHVAIVSGLQGQANKIFGDKRHVVVSAVSWRQSPRWCEGLEIELQVPTFPIGKSEKAEKILCIDKKYHDTFQKDEQITLAGRGAFLGMNIEEIGQTNKSSSIPVPKWD